MQRFADTFQQDSGPYASTQQAKHTDWRILRTVLIAVALMLAVLITMASLARPAHAAEEPSGSDATLETLEVDTSPSADTGAAPVTDIILVQDDSTPSDFEPVDIVIDEQPAPDPEPELEPEQPLIQSEETVPLYRIYNAQTSEHFYTTDCAERDSICSIGWVYEGVGWMVPLFSDLPVFRLYNPYAGDHHYTLSVIERDNLVEHEWRFEGISHYSAVDEAIPVYRQYNPNAWTGTHNFTIWPEEDQMLTGAGWHSEGVSWYAAALPVHEDGPGINTANLRCLVAGRPDWGFSTYGQINMDQRGTWEHHMWNGDVAFVAINHNTGACISYNAGKDYYSASSIKGPYIASLCMNDAPGIWGVRNTINETIYYSSNTGYSSLYNRYGRWYMDKIAGDSGVEIRMNRGHYTDITPLELAELWITIDEYLRYGGPNRDLFADAFRDHRYYKEGWIWGANYGGALNVLGGVEGDCIYAVATHYSYGDGRIWDLRNAILSAVC